MTLFDFNASSQLLSHGPLAHRMRPMNLNDFIGHSDIIGDNSIIKNALENNQLFSMIFWGPPGCGKTTLAKLIGNTDNAVARGAFGVPTFFFEDQIFFGKDHLYQLEEYINSKK